MSDDYKDSSLKSILGQFVESLEDHEIRGQLVAVVAFGFVWPILAPSIKESVLPLEHSFGAAVVLLLIGFLMAFLLMTRFYIALVKRWEPGRQAWGTILSSSSSLAQILAARLCGKDSQEEQWRKGLASCIGDFNARLAKHLRCSGGDPSPVATSLQRFIAQAADQKLLDEPTERKCLDLAVSLNDASVVCQNIQNNPLPRFLVLCTRLSILFTVLLLPLTVDTLAGILITPAMCVLCCAIEVSSELIDDPFGESPLLNHDVVGMAANIERIVNGILAPSANDGNS